MFSAAKTSGPSGYNINNSLRFRRSASAYLSRTPASAGNRQTWTMSVWVKRGELSADENIFNNFVPSPYTNEYGMLTFTANNGLEFYFRDSGATTIGRLNTTQVFRDPSAWYHIVSVVDTTNATNTDRLRIYINGTRVTAFSTATYPSQNTNLGWNLARQAFIAAAGDGNYLDGYLAEVNFIDGQALTPSSFGSTNATTGVWQPAKYTGTYGTNGFYLNFSNIALTSGSNTGLGKDYSGNGNYWNTNNISVTSGTTYDAMTDSPTLTSDTISNYTTISPLISSTNSIQNGNLSVYRSTAGSGVYYMSYSPFVMTSGKWYFEMDVPTVATHGPWAVAGIFAYSYASTTSQANYPSYPSAPNFYGVGINASNDIVGIAYDADNGKLWLSRNGTWLSGNPSTNTSPSYSGLTITNNYLPGVYTYTNGLSSDGYHNFNFGQRPFAYTLPTGFNRLNTYNLPTSTIVKGNSYMDATLYTGTNANLTITNAGGFKPDFVWIKSRSVSGNHSLFNSISGANKVLSSSLTMAEETPTAGTGLLSFNSNGFTLGADIAGVTGGETNGNGFTLVGWQWQAGQGSTSSNTSGSITSTVSVNTTAGFSVVTYTGTGSNATVGHGLGVAPRMIIVKQRSGAGQNWAVYHASLANTGGLALNLTNATITASGWWNNTSPTSSVFSLGGSTGSDWFTTNQSGSTYVAYCWAEIAGFSKFGSYVANGSADNTFVYTGFRPKYIMVKCTTAPTGYESWFVFDSVRNTYNSANAYLNPNNSNAEGVGTAGTDYMDLVSNGFKLRGTGAPGVNGNSGATYIYAAFAENPFKNALAR